MIEPRQGQTLGGRVRALRRERRLEQKQLARLSGVSRPYLSQIENDQRPNPSAETIDKLAQALGVTADVLLDDSVSSGQNLDQVPPNVSHSRDSDVGVRDHSAAPTSDRPRILKTEYVYYRLQGWANCGPGGGATTQEDEYVPLPTYALRLLSVERTEDLKLVGMRGPCMVPDLQEGDFALFDPNTVPATGDIVCLTVLQDGGPEEGEHIVKRVSEFSADGRIVVEPNVALPGQPARQSFTIDGAAVILEGVLVSVVHNINRPPRAYPMMRFGSRVARFAPAGAQADGEATG